MTKKKTAKKKAPAKPDVQVKLENRGWNVQFMKDGSVKLTFGKKSIVGSSLTNAYVKQVGKKPVKK